MNFARFAQQVLLSVPKDGGEPTLLRQFIPKEGGETTLLQKVAPTSVCSKNLAIEFTGQTPQNFAAAPEAQRRSALSATYGQPGHQTELASNNNAMCLQ